MRTSKLIATPVVLCFLISITIADGFVHTTAELEAARFGMAATSAGGKAFFAGGVRTASSVIVGGHSPIGWYSTVDIYDASTGTWSVDNLSRARGHLCATSVGTKAVFAGGMEYGHRLDLDDVKNDEVDIYDTATDTWSTAQLSQARSHLAATTVNDKAIFAGGEWLHLAGWEVYYSDRVDIYDNSTGSWTTASLSQARAGIAATTVGSKAIFAGGKYTDETYQTGYLSDVVDIYDDQTGTWSTTTLPVACTDMAAVSVGSKAIFTGGIAGYDSSILGATALVQVYDVDANVWYLEFLSEPRYGLAAAVVDGKALFAGGYAVQAGTYELVDIWLVGSSTWTATSLSEDRDRLVGTAVGNSAIFAGGKGGGGKESAAVDIFTLDGPVPVSDPLGDLNGDGIVDVADLNMVLIDWGNVHSNLVDRRSDADGSGTVDIVDINTVLIDWGKNFYRLIVNYGSGDGKYTAGQVVAINAMESSGGMHFDQWTGDMSGIADINAESTEITMPPGDANVTATYWINLTP